MDKTTALGPRGGGTSLSLVCRFHGRVCFFVLFVLIAGDSGLATWRGVSLPGDSQRRVTRDFPERGRSMDQDSSRRVWMGSWFSAAGDRLHQALFRPAKKVTASRKIFFTALWLPFLRH